MYIYIYIYIYREREIYCLLVCCSLFAVLGGPLVEARRGLRRQAELRAVVAREVDLVGLL